MIYLKLRQEGRRVNHKRVDRLYAEARLQVRRRRRKKVPLAGRQPLARPHRPNDVGPADFVFNRTAEGRVLKSIGAPLERRGGPLFSRSEARLPAESRQLGSLESRRTSS